MSDDYFLEQIAGLRRQVADLRKGRVTYRAATVTAVDTASSTFTADVAGAGTTSGIDSEPSFLPAVGDTVRLTLFGAKAVYQPHRIGEDAVGYTELTSTVSGDITYGTTTATTALSTANGKNRVTYSTLDPSGSGTVAGDPWFKRDATTGVVTGSWEWTGSAWQSRSYGDQVLNGLTAGKITAGTINADVLVAGQVATGTSGQRSGINSLGLFAYNAAGTKTVDLNGVSNLITGTMQTALTGRRIVTGAAGTTGEITFYPSSGTATSYLRSFTETLGVEALQLGLTSGQASDSPLWNRLNINSDEWTNLRSNKIDLNYLNGGVFVVRELSSRNTSAAQTVRMQIDAGSSLMFAPDNATAYQLSNGAHTFYPASSSSSGWIKVRPNLISDSNFRTPYLEFATDNNGVTGAGAYTGVMKVTVRTGGTNPTFQFRNGADTAWWGLEALSFVQSSSREFKTGISDYATEALPAVRQTKVRRYLVANDPAERIGLIAEESPTDILGPDHNSIDLYQMIALLWKAIQELDAKIPGGGKP